MIPVDIVNWAFGAMGVEPIVSLSDNTSPAKLANSRYEPTAKSLLSIYNWNFATKRIKLAQLATNDNNVYDYAYQMPSNYLRILKVRDDNNYSVEYEVQGDTIYADSGSVYLDYLYYNSDTVSYPMYFVEVLKDKLALDMCVPLTGRADLIQLFASLYEADLQRAKGLDAQQTGRKSITYTSDWETSRYV